MIIIYHVLYMFIQRRPTSSVHAASYAFIYSFFATFPVLSRGLMTQAFPETLEVMEFTHVIAMFESKGNF